MTVTRLILLVGILGGIMLLLGQNLSPAIPLVFLGLRTQPLSLAIWMLLGAAAGGLTSLLINSLVQLSTRYVPPQRQTSSYEPKDSARANKRTSREKDSYQRNPIPPQASRVQTPDEFENTYDDDWDLDRNVSDDWEFSVREYRATNSETRYTKIQDDNDYEDFRQPEDDYESADSSYSYNKRELKDSGIGKTESIYDADYRVVIPPPNPSTISNANQYSDNKEKENDDDWNFLEEDFEEDRPSPRQ
ncbi:MAG: LapA family protein [Cyanobacteria bacterium P01_D01_bin.50]